MRKQTKASSKNAQKKEGFSSSFIKKFSEELQANQSKREQR